MFSQIIRSTASNGVSHLKTGDCITTKHSLSNTISVMNLKIWSLSIFEKFKKSEFDGNELLKEKMWMNMLGESLCIHLYNPYSLLNCRKRLGEPIHTIAVPNGFLNSAMVRSLFT